MTRCGLGEYSSLEEVSSLFLLVVSFALSSECMNSTKKINTNIKNLLIPKACEVVLDLISLLIININLLIYYYI